VAANDRFGSQCRLSDVLRMSALPLIPDVSLRCRERSKRATSGQQPVNRTHLLKTDLDEIKGSEMNVWVADIAPGAATGTENRQGYV